MAIGEIITGFKDLCLAGAAITAAYVAIRGLRRWQMELTGKADFELARSVMKSVYTLRNEITYARSPLIKHNEFPEDYDRCLKKSDRDPHQEAEAWHHVYANRWRYVSEALNEFEVQILEAEALWGADTKEKLIELRKCATGLRVAMDCMIGNYAESDQSFANDKEYEASVRAEVSDTHSERRPNKYTKNLQSAVSEIESAIHPHLARN
jgi:hypothetical protein